MTGAKIFIPIPGKKIAKKYFLWSSRQIPPKSEKTCQFFVKGKRTHISFKNINTIYSKTSTTDIFI